MASRRAGGRKTLFLGAGATAASNPRALVTTDLLGAALRGDTSSANSGQRELANELVRELCGTSGPIPTIDELLALIDVALLDDLPLSPRWSVDRMVAARMALEALIYNAIETNVHGAEPPQGPLWELLDRECRSGRSAIVTLNWDCLAERMLQGLLGRKEGIIDYGLPCVTPTGEALLVDDDARLVLKPHGSLSWGYCLQCHDIVADLVKPFAFADGRRVCLRCRDSVLRHVLVAPVPYNRSRPRFLWRLWERVERVLFESDHIVFVGYSLPVQDVHVRLHLLRALARRKRRDAPDLVVEVVTRGDPRAPLTADAERRRFESFLLGTVSGRNFRFWAPPGGLADWLRTPENET